MLQRKRRRKARQWPADKRGGLLAPTVASAHRKGGSFGESPFVSLRYCGVRWHYPITMALRVKATHYKRRTHW